jgi:hypothetical protein
MIRSKAGGLHSCIVAALTRAADGHPLDEELSAVRKSGCCP